MGCDIHLYTEILKRINSEPEWCNVDNWNINHYYNQGEGDEYEVNSLYSGRNYELFSILADVRNGYDKIPIDSPRGLPSDASLQVKLEDKGWGNDGHSHSYFTLRELKVYAKQYREVSFYTGLEELIELLDQRMREAFWIFNQKECLDLEEKIRIVFWFDN